jgi:hypothetical protein
VPQITDLSTVPGAGEDKKERQEIGVNEDRKERRVSRRASVVRFAGGKGVRIGGAGYI